VLFRSGTFITPTNDPPHAAVRLAELTEASGYDLVTFQDHPYQPRFHDTTTLLTWVAARTERIHLAANVTNLPLRPPAVLARAAASLDLLSGGRFELGLGAGGFWDAIEAMGGPRRAPAEAVAALSEAIDVMRLWWSDQRSVRYAGDHYTLLGAHPGPRPAHDIGIWLGAYKPRMLDLVGGKADGWLPSLDYLPPDQLEAANARIDDAASAAGRDPASIQRNYNLGGDRSTDEWIELLTGWATDHGMSGFIFSGPATEAALRRVTDEIAPAVREAVAKERQS
jgi:alkanesulfonate monooxygenase SsuD/methylene tetrahydromethanopterin reductase-like flavin-dependent oxidoreductase (luciferase family)